MATFAQFRALDGSEHPHPTKHQKLGEANPQEELTITVMLRRHPNRIALKAHEVEARPEKRPKREAFASAHGSDQREMDEVVRFAKDADLKVLDADQARRSVVMRGTVEAISKAFAVQLNDYEYEKGKYRSHDGAVNVPAQIEPYVEAVFGLTNRKVEAKHWPTVAVDEETAAGVPPRTQPLTPAQVAALYEFPEGDGDGQTIGLYEMETSDGPAGYSKSDITGTMIALGNLPMPTIVDVSVDGTANSGKSDGETGLDITVSGAIAPKATLAVYFAGPEPQNILHALQMMVTPKDGEPAPSIISISYGWGADDPGDQDFSESEYAQFTQIFEDAATNKITVFVSSGDSGAYVQSRTLAQTSYPASDVWVTACGGTTIGNVGGDFDEWVWNNSGATGGGVSARFPLPTYQGSADVPVRLSTRKPGRGVPDIAGNASPYSGYLQVVNGGKPQPIGGTSAVAPLYAGLMARINANLGNPSGYLNATLYSLPASTFNDIVGAPGPGNNTYDRVTGYPAGRGWDACTGLGSVKGQALQDALAAAKTKGGSNP